MIASLIHILIVIVIVGLCIALIVWACEAFIAPIPPIAKKAIGVIALLLIALYALRLFGYA